MKIWRVISGEKIWLKVIPRLTHFNQVNTKIVGTGRCDSGICQFNKWPLETRSKSQLVLDS